ncbi:phage integrase N-terminal domain-containing protein [Nitrospira sp. Kam-Ns4a]
MGDWARSLADILREHGRVSADDAKRVSYETTAKRSDVLFKAFRELRGLGYKLEDVRSLKPKHIEALIQKWRQDGQAISTIHNKLSVLRVFAKWIGKPGIVRATESYGIPARTSGRADRSWSGRGVDLRDKLALVRAKDQHAAMQLELQRAFGLRMAEAARLRPHLADKGAYLSVHHGTKGGRDRVVPITTAGQRDVLDRAKALVGDRMGSMIPERYEWRQWRQHYYYVVRSCGISRDDGITSHGLRHERLQEVYQEHTGRPAPVRGGDPEVIPAEVDRAARQEVAEQAGHSRAEIATHYLGRQL